MVATQGVLRVFWFASWIHSLWCITTVQGAAAGLFAATSPAVRTKAEVYRGAYLGRFGVLWEPSKYGKDAELGRTLCKTSEE